MNIQTMMYKNLEWYIINETEKEKLLFLKDCFTNEIIKTYFDKYNHLFNVDFRFNYEEIWWKDSYIREILNGPFLNYLDINDLNVMKTTLELNGNISTTKDYVRLITIEEVERLQKSNIEVLKTEREHGYWTMNPNQSLNGIKHIFIIQGSNGNNGHLDFNNNNFSYAVRPIISLKQNNIITEEKKIITSGYTPEQLENIKRLQKLSNI